MAEKDIDRGDAIDPKADPAVDDGAPAAETDEDDDLNAAIEAMRNGGKKSEPEPEAVEEETPEPKDDPMIPKARLDEATGKLKSQVKELEDRLAQQQQAQQPATAPEPAENPYMVAKSQLAEAKDIYEDALLENDKATAASARELIDELQEEMQTMMMQTAVTQARTQTNEDVRYNQVLTSIETANPALNPDSDQFDREVMQQVARISSALTQSGTPASQALQEATDLVMAKQAPAPTSPDNELRDRTKENRKSTAAAAVAQSPDLNDIGMNKGTVDPVIKPSKLNQDQFAKLPEDIMKQLRGDVVE